MSDAFEMKVEGGLGLTICVVYLFLYVCSISVDNITEDSESESTSVDQVMAGIYSYYIASGRVLDAAGASP